MYFLSTIIEDTRWIVKSREIYSKNLEKKVDNLFFLRPNFVNAYNYDMNSLDWADQLRTNYQVSVGLRQRKWWWSIFLWAFDVAIVNSYLLYKSYSKMHGFQPKSYYTYREEIFKAWMDSDIYWAVRYSRKSKREMKLISQSPDLKRTRVSSGSISSLGEMTKRLTFSVNCTNLPAPPCSKYSECQLHQLTNKQTRKQVITCNNCNATLCINCYKSFHTAHDINMIKADIENDQESTIKTIIPSLSSFKLKNQYKLFQYFLLI